LGPTPWYDLVSVLPYDGFDTGLAMAYGDVFTDAEVSPFALADFAVRCGIDRKLMRREGERLGKLATTEAAAQTEAADYEGDAERAIVQGIATFVSEQAKRLTQLVADAARWKDQHH
jgi:serine/threonine-protein kinase HipA